MKLSILPFIPTATLVAIATIPILGISAPRPGMAQPLLQRSTVPTESTTLQRVPTQNTQRTPSRPAQPTASQVFQVPDTTSAVQCGPTTCTCDGIDDCDALFTSTLCAPGTETTTEDDHGQCTANN